MTLMTMYQYKPTFRDDSIRAVRNVIEQAMAESGSRFIGLENATEEKETRRWSIAPRPPHARVNALKGKPRRMPSHIMIVWSADCHAWRSVDLTTVRRVWWIDQNTGVRKDFDFEG